MKNKNEKTAIVICSSNFYKNTSVPKRIAIIIITITDNKVLLNQTMLLEQMNIHSLRVLE